MMALPSTHGAKVLLLASCARSLVNFRGPLMRALVDAGCRVVGCGPEDDPLDAGPEVSRDLAALGVPYRRVPMARTGLNPFADLRTLLAIAGVMRAERPDIVLAYTMKPVIYGSLAARLLGVPRRFAMITGLGYVFGDRPSVVQRLVRMVSCQLYRLALSGSDAVIFFNPDDQAEFVQRHVLRPGQPAVRVDGSGVDTDYFAAAPVPEGPPTFLLAARLLRHKGIGEFVAAARLLRGRWPHARFQLLGWLEPTPGSITQAEVNAWRAEGVVDYLGGTLDVRPYLRDCTVLVLPSYYREGIPRAVVEALATGRAVITTDSPGCRETVIPGENGFLVAPREATALARAMELFLEDPALAVAMGRRSRELALARFDVRKVNATMLTTLGVAHP
jgi:glycosyltransferase involved in cell wall biosynthesis